MGQWFKFCQSSDTKPTVFGLKLLSLDTLVTASYTIYAHILLELVDYELRHLSPLPGSGPRPPGLEPVIELDSRGVLLLERHVCKVYTDTEH